MEGATSLILVAGELLIIAFSFSKPTFPPPTINTDSCSSFRKTGKS
jgi:hypothetical protein